MPLSQADQAAGWTTGAQKATLTLLGEIRNSLVEGRPIAKINIGRGLDHWDIEDGGLFERACALSNSLREIQES